jgi:hypothetical protein
MQKYLGAFVFGGMVGIAGATAFGPKVVANQKPAQAPQAITVAVGELPGEQIRHMRGRKKSLESEGIGREIEETSKKIEVSGVPEQANTIIDSTPTGSVKPPKPRKTKLSASRSKRKMIDQQEANVEQAPSAETEASAPRGFFDALFQGN